MDDFKSITVTKGEKTLLIDNPTSYPLVGVGSQGAVFKLSQNVCVKIYSDPVQAQMEQEALMAGKHLPFFPKVSGMGENYVVMEYFDAPTLKEYLRNSTYIPESITRKLLYILHELKQANFTMVDAPLRHIFVLPGEELKVIDHVNAFKRIHPVPLKLLRDLKMMLLKDSFIRQVRQIDPGTYASWQNYFSRDGLDFRNLVVSSGGEGSSVKVDSAAAFPLVGAGHQGAVYRVAEDKCVKIYSKEENAQAEQKVLTSSQNLPFIPKVYETGPNYILMEYLTGPDLNTYLKKQTHMPIEITKQLLYILGTMEQTGFSQLDAPLRHIIVTSDGFKMVDHVYSFTRVQVRPLELFKDLHIRGFLDAFLEQVKMLDPGTHAEWTRTPIPLQDDEIDQTTILSKEQDQQDEENHDKHGRGKKAKDKHEGKGKHQKDDSPKGKGKKDKDEGHKGKGKHDKGEDHKSKGKHDKNEDHKSKGKHDKNEDHKSKGKHVKEEDRRSKGKKEKDHDHRDKGKHDKDETRRSKGKHDKDEHRSKGKKDDGHKGKGNKDEGRRSKGKKGREKGMDR